MNIACVTVFFIYSDNFNNHQRVYFITLVAMCPKGDDPLTVNQNYREILLTVQSSSASLSGSLGVEFLGQRSILSLSNPSGPNCIKGLEQSDFITSVNCTFMMASSNRYLYNITFIKFPTFTKENNFHTNDGNPLVTDFYCDGSLASSGVTCVFTDVVNTGLRGELAAVSHVLITSTACFHF